ncbi:MAG: restriction endonuclease subunit S [Saprospiraceae bacterium]|nr:restriction endonuclease subunit S [Saprospiraceae bacterium]
MSEWKEYKLEEVTEPIKDTFIPDGRDNFAYIGLEHIEQESLRLNSIGISSEVTSNKFLFKSNDVLFGKLRPYFRKVVKPQFDGICSTDIWVFRAKKGFDQNYLHFFIANWDFVNLANSGEGGTRMPRADWTFLKATGWKIPPLPEQIQIASILSSLDDKIDLLHRQNKTLEQLAESLFRQWFEEEVQESWAGVKLGDLIEIKGGFSYKGEFIGSGDSLLLGMGCVSFDKRFLISGARPYSGDCDEKHLAKPGDLVIATRQQSDNLPILGFPAIIPEEFVEKKVIVGANLYKVKNDSELNNYFLYNLLRGKEYRNHILASSKGSTVRMITKDAIESFKFNKPSKELINK